MKIHPTGNKDYVYGGKFTGPVQLEMIIEAAVPTDPDLARVHFSNGAVTNWHVHPGGQHLLLVEGVGRVGNEEGEFTGLLPGTVVETPADENHWHGADAGQDAVWFAMTWGITGWTDNAPVDPS